MPKITALNAMTQPDDADLLAVVNDPAGVPETQKATLAAVQAKGGIYCTAGAATQTPGVSPGVKITQFNGNMPATANVVPDHTNDQVTVNRSGVGEIKFQVSFSGAISATFYVVAYVGAVAIAQVQCKRKLGTGGDVGSASGTGTYDFSVGDVVTLWAYSTVAGKNFDLEEGQLMVSF